MRYRSDGSSGIRRRREYGAHPPTAAGVGSGGERATELHRALAQTGQPSPSRGQVAVRLRLTVVADPDRETLGLVNQLHVSGRRSRVP